MPRHDDRHARPDVDMVITTVFLILMIAVLLFLLGMAHPHRPLNTADITYHSMPAVPPM
jgi:hypothetical protein